MKTAIQKWNNGDLEGYLNTLYDPQCTFYYFPPELPQGKGGARLFYGGFLAGFPDAQLVVDDTIVEGDSVVARYRLEATHQGEFNGIPPTGKTAVLNGITLMRFANGKVVERWNEADFLGFLQQLGAIPAPQAA